MAQMLVKTRFDFGQIVYLKTDPDQHPGIIIGFEIFPGGELMYKVSFSGDMSVCYEIELSEEKDFKISV